MSSAKSRWAALPDPPRWLPRWKGLDWDVLDRVCRKGFICGPDPVDMAKSAASTDAGLRESERLFKQCLAVPDEADQ